MEKVSGSFFTDIYKAFTNTKDFGFKDQFSRSALSIPSNIAERYERESNKEITNFINYAKGSSGELRTRIYIGIDIGYQKLQKFQKCYPDSSNSFVKEVKGKRTKENWRILQQLFFLARA